MVLHERYPNFRHGAVPPSSGWPSSGKIGTYRMHPHATSLLKRLMKRLRQMLPHLAIQEREKMHFLAWALCLLLGMSQAHANDSTAVLASDGLRLTSSADVEMRAETLTITPEHVHVRYVFHAPHETVTTIVAFPLPLLPFSEMEPEVAIPGSAHDPVHFRVRVNGHALTPRLQARALINGVDFTALLTKHGIAPTDILEMERLLNKIGGLSPQARQELVDAGLLHPPSPDIAPSENWQQWNATWDIELLYWWRQTFPKGRDVTIEHDYAPISGTFFFDTDQVPVWVRRTYCTEPAFLKAARRKGARNPANKVAGGAPILIAREIHYVLTTGANWAGPIRRFHLVIDKMRPHDLVSLCWHDLKRISSTRFAFTARNFTPRHDLKILFLQDLPGRE